MTVRRAAHSGPNNWYTDNAAELTRDLEGALRAADQPTAATAKALICPHAGYFYSMETAAYSYVHLENRNDVKRVFILGPSHHVGTDKVFLPAPGTTTYAVPNGDLELDLEIIDALRSSSAFADNRKFSVSNDEDEHSVEMQLPFLSHCFKDRPVGQKPKIVPMVVGHCNHENTRRYAELLRPYYDDPQNFFVISSDFCHWGNRFGFEYLPVCMECGSGGNRRYVSRAQVNKLIESLDKDSMDLLEQKNYEGWERYLEQTQNTICGRHPISILMAMIHKDANVNIKFVHYSQSGDLPDRPGRCDSCVSYAAGVVSLT